MNFSLIQKKNTRKTWFIIIIFSGLIISIGYALTTYTNNISFLGGSVLMSIIGSWTSYFNSDKIAIKSSGSKQIDLNTKEGQRLKRIISDLSQKANIPEPKIYIMNDMAINAFATGRNPEHASVSVTAGALKLLDDRELSGVLAHELTHVKNKDILVMTVVVSLAGIFIFLVRTFGQISSRRSKNPLALISMFALPILAPIAVAFIRSSVSRKREYMADAGSAIITKDSEALASALEKIKKYSKPMIKKSLHTSHLFISSPYRADISGIKLSFLENLFADHPPIDERIRILREGVKK